MSATFWLVFSIVCFSLAFVALVAAVFAFIKMNVPAIIGDINGKTVTRGVEAMKKANERGAKQTFKDYGMAKKKPIDIDLKASFDAMSRAHVSKRLDMAPGKAEAFAQQMHNDNGGTENIYYATERVQDFSEQPKGIGYKTTPLVQVSAENKGLNDYKTTPLVQKNSEDTVNQVELSQNNKVEKASAYHTSVLNNETTILHNTAKQQYGTTVLDGNSTVEEKQSVKIEITTKKISVNTDETI